MIKIFTKINFFGFLLILSIKALAQQTGDFKSKASGNWDDFATWQIYNGTSWQDAIAGQIPGGTNESDANNVFLEAGFTIVLESDHSCKNLNLNTATDVVRINTQDNSLEVWGKMKFYEGTAPGSTTPNPVTSSGITGWITTGPNGSIRFKGNINRVIMVQGEVNSNNSNSGWNLDFAFVNGVTGELNDRIRAGNITVSSGILFQNNASAELRVGTNNGATDLTPNGQLIVKSGAIVKGGAGIFKKANVAAQTITVENGATLEISRSSYVLAASVLNLNGIVILQNAINFPTEAARTGAVPVNTFTNLILDGTGAKTLQNNITVNGKLTLSGTASLNLSTFLLSYGAAGELEYKGSSSQTTSIAEFPNVNGPFNLIINNANGVTLNANKTINGLVTLSSGLFSLGNNNLTLGASSPAIAGTPSATNMIVTNGTGELIKLFTSTGTFFYPVGSNSGTAEYSYAQIKVNSADLFNGATYFGIRVKKAEHPAVVGIASASLHRYWEVSTNTSGYSYNGIFQYLPADVNGDENTINSYIFPDETALAIGTPINKVNTVLHRIVINNITQTGFVTAANLCPISNNTISTTSANEFCGSATGIVFDGTPAIVTSGTPVYQWQKSVNDGNWTDILTDGLSEDFTENGSLSPGIFSYRRVVSDPVTCDASFINISNEITIAITEEIEGNTIGSDQTVANGADADPLAGTEILSGGDGVFTYQWKSSTTQAGPYTNINLANSSTLDVPEELIATTYFVREVKSATCTSISNEVSITLIPTSVNQSMKDIVSIYPNPISLDNKVFIDLGDNNYESGSLTLLNITGMAVYNESFNAHSNKLVVDMTDYSKGVYFIQLVIDNKKVSLDKIIKE